jgi:hypothetical protein
MAGDAPCGPLGEFVLAQRREQARGPQPSRSAVAPSSCQSRPMVGSRRVFSMTGSLAASTVVMRHFLDE